MTGHTDHTGHIGRFTGRVARRGAHRRPGRAAPPEALPDAALLAGARQGDAAAFAELYRRHAEEVWRHAREHGLDAHTAEDVTEEAFAQTLQELREGRGPSSSPRDHLLATVRRLAAGRPTADPGERPASATQLTQLSAEAHAMVQADRDLLVAAFSSLPDRWREVLWRTAVERQSLGRVGSELGLTTNATAVLAFRAREGLRQAYLQAHVSDDLAGREACGRYAGRLGAFIRGSSASRGLRRHLDGCDRCRGAYLELVDVNATLRAVFPVVGVGWLASAVATSWPEATGGGGVAGATGATGAATGAGGGGSVLGKLALAASVAFTAGSMSQQPSDPESEFGHGQQRAVAASAPDADPAAEGEGAHATQGGRDDAPPSAELGPRPSGSGDASDAGSSCPYVPDDEAAVISVSTDLVGYDDGMDDADGLDGVGDVDCRTGLSTGFSIDAIDPTEPAGSVDHSIGPIDAGRPGGAAAEEATGAVDAIGAAARQVTELLPLPEPEDSPSGDGLGLGGLDALDALDTEPPADQSTGILP